MNPAVTRQVQEAVKSMPLGATFTVADIAERMGADRRAVARILARGGIGAELVEIRREPVQYPSARITRDVRVYRRAEA